MQRAVVPVFLPEITMNSRRLAWVVVGLSAAVFSLAVWAMGTRIAEFNRHANFIRFHAEPVISREFRLEGWPQGRLTDRTETVDGIERSFLELDYAGKSTLIPVKTPPAKDVPNLSVYDEWAKVLGFNEMASSSSGGESQPVSGSTRLWIITRTTPPGYDENTWGSVRRSEWVFTFYELRRDGSVTIDRRRWPRGYKGEKLLQAMAAAHNAKPTEDSARYAELAKIPVLKERSAEYYAAMFVIPKINMPQYKFEDTALRFNVLGWTVPAAGFAVLGMLYGTAFAIAPKRTVAVPVAA